MKLRSYQTEAQDGVLRAWQHVQNVMLVSATGSGKTVTAMDLARRLGPQAVGVVQAHRAELVGQLSVALGRAGVPHALNCSTATRRTIVEQHFHELGRSYFDPGTRWAVESVDTALKRSARAGVGYVFVDEAHHVLRENKWGRAVTAYENARLLGVTATPTRADGQGLGAHRAGLMQRLVLGPGSARLMREGFLCEYAIKIAVSDAYAAQMLQVGASGEYTQDSLSKMVKGERGAKIVGDAVQTWLDHCPGKLTITFACDIDHATELRQQYRERGVAAELLTGKDTEAHRTNVIAQFKRREISVLINVDLFGEGFDVPACEVVQMCRPTASFSLFSQMVGRVLRLDIAGHLHEIWDSLTNEQRRAHIAASRKPRGLVIDHVGNFTTSYKVGEGKVHVGPPELFEDWDLEGRQKRGPSDAIPTKLCLHCGVAYEAWLDACDACGCAWKCAKCDEPNAADATHCRKCCAEKPQAVAARGTPEQVKGNVFDFDPELLARLRAQMAHIDREPITPTHLTGYALDGAIKQWQARRAAHHHMREAIAYWAGARRQHTDAENYKLFFLRFGVDVATALTLSASDSYALIARIQNDTV